MKLSPTGYALIEHFEGLSLHAYQDIAGYWTCGYGHKLIEQQGQHTPGVITKDEADRLLTSDVAFAEKCVSHLVKIELRQREFDALTAFVFNVGPTHFADSTMLKQLNAGRRDLASAEFPKWVRAAGEESAGLKRRRLAEQDLFEGRDWQGPHAPTHPGGPTRPPTPPAAALAAQTRPTRYSPYRPKCWPFSPTSMRR